MPLTPIWDGILTDEVGNNWQVDDGLGEAQSASRSPDSQDTLSESCPSQAYAPSGGNIIYLQSRLLENGPSAKLQFPQGRNQSEFIINLALIPHSSTGDASFRTKIVWLDSNQQYRTRTQDHGPISSPCDIALHESTLGAGLDMAGRRDLMVGVITEVTVMPGTGAEGLFVFNMTIPGSEDTATPSGASNGESTGPTTSDLSTSTPSTLSSLSQSQPSHPSTVNSTSNLPSVDQSQTQGTVPQSSIATSPTQGSPGVGESEPLTRATIIAITLSVVFAILLFTGSALYLFRRRRRRRHGQYIGTMSSSPDTPHASMPHEVDPPIVPFQLFEHTRRDSLPGDLDRRTKGKPFPGVVPEPSEWSGSDSTSDASQAGEGEIVRAVHRAGLTTQELLRSLDRMVPEPDAVESRGETLPPEYARIA
ncbi:hypothetical protein BKA62DRAFT_834052 [Auriculariales sp. MPI-PUGE-AT-0066]|nr:hypothetical protein BKA62DRAFT_834052 [Auriculariales sp. MPI-PUGE-AT-0066]